MVLRAGQSKQQKEEAWRILEGSPWISELRGALHLSLGKGHVVTMGIWSLSLKPASHPRWLQSSAAHSEPQILCLYCNSRNVVKSIGLSGKATKEIQDALHSTEKCKRLNVNYLLNYSCMQNLRGHFSSFAMPKSPPRGDTTSQTASSL